MDIPPHFAPSNEKTALAVDKFQTITLLDPGVMAAALCLAKEAPGGALNKDFVTQQKAHVTHEVAEALGAVNDFFAYNGDRQADFYSQDNLPIETRREMTRLQRISLGVSDPTVRGELKNRCRILPLEYYLGRVATFSGGYLPERTQHYAIINSWRLRILRLRSRWLLCIPAIARAKPAPAWG